jgi:hypothetical protein
MSLYIYNGLILTMVTTMPIRLTVLELLSAGELILLSSPPPIFSSNNTRNSIRFNAVLVYCGHGHIFSGHCPSSE